jgi:hypothetical protein
MSNTDLGSQTVTFDYQEPATGKDFNTVLRTIIKAGLYSGAILSKIDNSTISISPFDAWFNVGTNRSCHISTSAPVVLTATFDKPILYMTFSWADIINNFIDFGFRAVGSQPVANEIQIGIIGFTGVNVNGSFDYSAKTVGLIDNVNNIYAQNLIKFDTINDVSISKSAPNMLSTPNNLSIGGSVNAGGPLVANGYAVVNGMTVSGNINITGNENIGGNSVINGTANIGGIITAGNNVNITGNVSAANFDTDGTLAANSNTKIATQRATRTYADTKLPNTYLDIDGTLAANSDVKIPSQKAVKTYVNNKIMPYVYATTYAGGYLFNTGSLAVIQAWVVLQRWHINLPVTLSFDTNFLGNGGWWGIGENFNGSNIPTIIYPNTVVPSGIPGHVISNTRVVLSMPGDYSMYAQSKSYDALSWSIYVLSAMGVATLPEAISKSIIVPY